MRLGKFSLFFNTYLLPVSWTTIAKPDLRKLYQLNVTCYQASARDIEDCIRQELNLPAEVMQAMFIAPQEEGDVTHLQVRVLCMDTGKHHLQQLVHRLGMDAAVRSISWKVIAEKLTAA